LSLQRDYYKLAASEHDQYNQVTSSWHMVCGLVYSTLDVNKQRSITRNSDKWSR